MLLANCRISTCVFIAWTVHISQSSSSSIEKRFYSLFLSNFAKVCIQAFGIESLVLTYYIFYGNICFINFKYFQGV